MGLFGGLGSLFGPVGGLIGGAVDSFLGYKQAKKQNEDQQAALQQAAQTDAGAQRQLIALQQQAMEIDQKMQAAAIQAQREGNGQALQLAQQGVDISRQGLNADQQGKLLQTNLGLQQAAGAQAQDLPTNIARQSALGALPYLQAMQGLPAYAIPTNVAQTDFLGMQQSGVPGAGNLNGAGMGGGGNLSSGYQMQQIHPDLSQVMQLSPLYQQQANDLQARLAQQGAASGIMGSTQYRRELGDQQSRLLSAEQQRILQQLGDMVKFGQQGPLQSGLQVGSAALNPLGQMGQGYGQIAQSYGQAAGLAQQGGGSLANLYHTDPTARDLSYIAQLGYMGQMQGRNDQAALAGNAQQSPQWLNYLQGFDPKGAGNQGNPGDFTNFFRSSSNPNNSGSLANSPAQEAAPFAGGTNYNPYQLSYSGNPSNSYNLSLGGNPSNWDNSGITNNAFGSLYDKRFSSVRR